MAARRPLCSWCNHGHTGYPCTGEIQTGTTTKPNNRPCPCNRYKKKDPAP